MFSKTRVRTAEQARSLMKRAIADNDESILKPYVSRASTDAIEEAFAIVRGSAGVDMTVTQRFLTVMLMQKMLTVAEVASFTRETRLSKEVGRLPA